MSEKYITAIHLWWYKCPTRKGWVWHHPQDNTDPTDRLSRQSQVWGFLFTTDSPCNSQVSHNYRCLAGNRPPNNSAINLGFPHHSWKTTSWYLCISCICFWWDPTQQSLRKQQFYGFGSLNNNKHALVKTAAPKKYSCRNDKTTENVRVWCRNTPCTLEQCPRWVSFVWFGQEPLPNTPQKTL